MSHAGKVCAHSWHSLFFLFPRCHLSLCAFINYFRNTFLNMLQLFLIKTLNTKSFFIHVVFIWQKQDPSTWWNSVQVQFPMINLRQKHSTWNPNWTHTLALPFKRPILSFQISRSDRTRNIFQHIKSVISRKLLASACHTHKANLFFARLSGHLSLAEKIPSSYLPEASDRSSS